MEQNEDSIPEKESDDQSNSVQQQSADPTPEKESDDQSNSVQQQSADPTPEKDSDDQKHEDSLKEILDKLKRVIPHPDFHNAADNLIKDKDNCRKNLVDLLYHVEKNISQNQKQEQHKEKLTVKIWKAVTGKTFDAEETLLKEVEHRGQLKLKNTRQEDCEVCIMFCPVTDRPGSDVLNAISQIKGDKPVILVVMHHTRKPDFSTEGIKWSHTSGNICLEAHALFHETQPGLLECPKNHQAVNQIQGMLRHVVKENRKHRHVFLKWLPKPNQNARK
ncbi:uncharacterized protein ACNS7B_023995 isoform 2-T2 [Menidia menidia]